ncbi:MAG: Type 1 glutamine amidotransferase-like domain-containing protein [Pseudomonadota bacterium]
MERRSLLKISAAFCAAPAMLQAKAKLPSVIAFGGGRFEERLLKRLPRVSRGRTALIAPYAARDPDGALGFGRELLKNLGYRNVSALPLSGSAQEMIAEADLILFSGGAQKRQVLTLGQVPGMHDWLRAAHSAGTVMAGGSAGAAVMSKLMISGGTGGNAYTRSGLGFLPRVVLDQHVGERGREYRLRKVISANRGYIGIGMDEQSGVEVSADTAKVYATRGKSVRLVWWSGGLQERILKRGEQITLPS